MIKVVCRYLNARVEMAHRKPARIQLNNYKTHLAKLNIKMNLNTFGVFSLLLFCEIILSIKEVDGTNMLIRI